VSLNGKKLQEAEGDHRSVALNHAPQYSVRAV
jgi:hypothetical protein